MIADSLAGQARIPHAVRRLLTDALALRARRDGAQIGGAALADAIAALETRLDKLLAAKVTHEPNRRLLAHLSNEREAIFTFLRAEDVPATNHHAERAIRPQVCARKSWGGNKSWTGARTRLCSAACHAPPPSRTSAPLPSSSRSPPATARPRDWT